MDTTIPPKQKRRSIVHHYFKRMYALKESDAFLLKLSLLSTALFLILMLIQVSTNYTERVAKSGGVYAEGILGTPRFANPVLAVTRADKDLTTLVYDGLMTLGPDGTLIPNIAESVTVSDDGLTYNVLLKHSVQFHDGTPLTARDVVFTFNRIQDPVLGSPLRTNFEGITIEEVGSYELNFILPEAYSPFIENLTFGILPEHIWKDAGNEEFPFSQYNSEPIGSGPYQIDKIIRNTSGIPETYILKANKQYFAEIPKIATFELHFFPTEEKLAEAFSQKLIQGIVAVDANKVSPFMEKNTSQHLERIPLPRTIGVFFNQNKATALRDSAARNALNEMIDRDALITQVLNGYGNALASPVPPGFGFDTTQATNTTHGDVDTARDILRNGGWTFNEGTQLWEKDIDGSPASLSFSLATVNNSGFEATAEFLRNAWQNLGVPVTIKQFEQTDLTQGIIRPRDYEALLFGTQLGRSFDYYSFWHSSQRNNPGLNIALYANITVDSILSEMRRSTNTQSRTDAIKRFNEEIQKETPALFLYAPELLYVFPNNIHDAHFNGISEPHERFMGVQHWYIETEAVWPFFTKKTQ